MQGRKYAGTSNVLFLSTVDVQKAYHRVWIHGLWKKLWKVEKKCGENDEKLRRKCARSAVMLDGEISKVC